MNKSGVLGKKPLRDQIKEIIKDFALNTYGTMSTPAV